MAARQAVRMPPRVAPKAARLFFVQPLMRYIVAARTMTDVMTAAATGPIPRRTMGKKRKLISGCWLKASFKVLFQL